MAPSRRKGARKAAAAAAACRQWKVGDLVLAKVKGFPAWPARVSEPEKWEFSADSKKVFVYFFGTEQIAFCNPADVELFTEERKNSLSGKRHGKGADYVRAVREIIDCFDKLGNQDQGTDVHSGDDVTMANVRNSTESLSDSPKEVIRTCPESTDSTKVKDDVDIPVEETAAATQTDPLPDKDTPAEDPNMVISEMPPQPTTYSRKKHAVGQMQNFVTQKQAPSARRSRSSSRADSRKFQNFLMPSSSSRKSNGLCDASSRRSSRRVRNSAGISEVNNDVGSPVFVSNGSLEENSSEIVTADSDTLSFNEGSTVESGYGLMQLDSVLECSEGDVDLSKRPDFQRKGVIVKKKRKPSRKRANTELSGKLEKDPDSEMDKSGQILPSDVKNVNGKFSGEDGDEHLPLFKRARVRMGRPSSGVGQAASSVQPEEKSSDASDSPVVDRSSSDAMVDLNNTSPVNKCPVNKAPIWEIKKQFGCLVDGEAALPPSKRIHRALEAMSANVGEDGQSQTTSETPSSMKTFMNASCFSFVRDCLNTSLENKSASEFGLHNVDSTNLIQPVVEEGTTSFIKVEACNTPVRNNNSPKLTTSCDDVLMEAGDCADCRGSPGVSSLGTHMARPVVELQSPKPLSPVLVKEQSSPECEQGLEDLTPPSVHGCKVEKSELEKSCREDDTSGLSRKNSDPVSARVEIAIDSTQDDSNLLPNSSQNTCETTDLLKLALDEDNQENAMCIVKEEMTLEDSKATIQYPSTEARTAGMQDPHLYQSTFLSEDHLSNKNVSGIQSSSSPAGGVDSSGSGPPPESSSTRDMSGSDNSIILASNGSCSPDVHLPLEKPIHAGKSSTRVEANAALASFEVNLRLLTRTKDSIGRATRMAIDCAKLGIAAKVVETLAQNLENEPSLRRRVDLFFLVDSITQCSRGLKGNVGGVYPSAIQAVLPRLLLAAAPPGSHAQEKENRRQCLKVLRLWQERKVLPESIIHRHIRDLDSSSNLPADDPFCRRVSRTERAFDDPLREVEGMVDEYGSNSSFELPGFRMPPMLKDEDEGCDSDGESFEAVTPEHNNSENPDEVGKAATLAVNKKRSHILEDVDGELEMEDLAPINGGVDTAEISHHQFEQNIPLPRAPPLPKDVHPPSPPLPTSPHPLPPPPPPPSVMPYVGAHPIENDRQQFVPQQSVAAKIDPMISDPVLYQAPENRNPRIPMQIPDAANSCSFGNRPVPYPPIRPVNNVPHVDGATLHNNAFHLRPPHRAPSNQFSYVQADQRAHTRREVPSQSYHNNGFHFVQNSDRGNFYSGHDRMEPTTHDVDESWRHSEPSRSGACYHDNGRGFTAPGPFGGPPREPAMPSHNWAYPPRPMNHREIMPHRPPLDGHGPIPVASRAPNFWRPR